MIERSEKMAQAQRGEMAQASAGIAHAQRAARAEVYAAVAAVAHQFQLDAAARATAAAWLSEGPPAPAVDPSTCYVDRPIRPSTYGYGMPRGAAGRTWRHGVS